MTDIYLVEATPEYAEQVWQFRQEVFDYDNNSENQFAGCLSLDEAASAEEWIRLCQLSGNKFLKLNYNQAAKRGNLLLGGFFLKLTKYKEYAIIRQTGGLRFEKICYCRISIGYSVSFEYFIAIAYPKAFQFLGGNNELYQGRRCAAAEHY